MSKRSWVAGANDPEGHFPLANLPYGVFAPKGGKPRCGVAIGDMVLDLAGAEAGKLVSAGGDGPVFDREAINDFMALGAQAWRAVRDRLTELLAEDGDPAIATNAGLSDQLLHPIAAVETRMPFKVSGYTDFNSARQHAFNAGSMFRGPENALPANWLHLPIGYNGRPSTVVVSGTDIRRPLGQRKAPDAAVPSFGPCQRLDLELEMGTVLGLPSRMGEPLTVAEADDLIFGYVLLNDWSARDIQSWESQPLGPFQAKVFGTSISPWVVTKAALEPFRTSTPEREKPLLPYLREPGPMLYDIELEVLLQPDGAPRATTIAHSNFRHLYFSPAQHVAHHAVGGCLMQTGDLLGTGTISGPGRSEFGSLLELSWNGREPITLETGETRSFLEDGDTLTLTGWAQGDGYRIGFGRCSGTILPSPAERAWHS